jgi:hypothetical protein
MRRGRGMGNAPRPHLATHALKLGLQLSQCRSDRLKPATFDPSRHATFPKGLVRFPGH